MRLAAIPTGRSRSWSGEPGRDGEVSVVSTTELSSGVLAFTPMPRAANTSQIGPLRLSQREGALNARLTYSTRSPLVFHLGVPDINRRARST